uniref:Uncharacterized protein LOC117354870 n=1 Tax=Geotrypetes seraphini TaxID=260995 RepID=A0A6P8Q1D8_GEOSA|nr:uncharacterized protein LOC117354870 [Geotrypetes seraphini]
MCNRAHKSCPDVNFGIGEKIRASQLLQQQEVATAGVASAGISSRSQQLPCQQRESATGVSLSLSVAGVGSRSQPLPCHFGQRSRLFGLPWRDCRAPEMAVLQFLWWGLEDRSCGNFRPYQCVGQLILDNQELLSRCLSPEKQEGLTVGYIPGLFSKHCHPTYRDGYQHIKNYRNELQKIHNAVASNQGLSSCLTVQKVDVPLSQRKSPRGLSQEETKSLSGKQEKSSSLKETLSNFLETEPDDPEEREQLRIYHRNHEYILEKLQVIFMLLCGITSMKAVDLKTLKPLSQEQVKIFTKDILIGKKSICYFVPPPSYIKKTSHYSEGPALEDLQFITPENTWESLLNEKALCFRKSGFTSSILSTISNLLTYSSTASVILGSPFFMLQYIKK